jgi:hypothetical protein
MRKKAINIFLLMKYFNCILQQEKSKLFIFNTIEHKNLDNIQYLFNKIIKLLYHGHCWVTDL